MYRTSILSKYENNDKFCTCDVKLHTTACIISNKKSSMTMGISSSFEKLDIQFSDFDEILALRSDSDVMKYVGDGLIQSKEISKTSSSVSYSKVVNDLIRKHLK